MSVTNLSQALATIQEGIRNANRVLGELENYLHAGDGYTELESDLQMRLTWHLTSLGRQMPVLLEFAGLTATRSDFLTAWKDFGEKVGHTETLATSEDVYLVSRPLELLEEIVRVLRGDSEAGIGEGQAAQLQTLEYVLRSTPQILRTRGVHPTKEIDVQRVLESHLEFTFSDYTKQLTLPKGLKSFKPDGAIPSLEAVIEFKFIDSERAMPIALSGIMEDISGYGGSKDWRHFYSLMYQTEPFVSEERFRGSLRLSGNAAQWRTIVVTGPGGSK